MRMPARSQLTRRPILVAIAMGLAFAAALFAAASAGAGAYVVVQCEAGTNPGLDSTRYSSAKSNQYALQNHCGNPGGDPANALGVKVVNKAPVGRLGEHRWVPAASTTFVAIRAIGKLRRENGHKARLRAGSSVFGSAGTGTASWKTYNWSGSGAGDFTARLICDTSPNCKNSAKAKTQVRGVRITVRDSSVPTVSGSGTLVAGGWRRGLHGFRVDGSDLGGGIRQLRATVNSQTIGTGVFPCSLISSSMVTKFGPCGLKEELVFSGVNTANAPFQNGSNTVQVCAWDLGTVETANSRCQTYTVKVDNLDPQGRFRSSLDPTDPELIRAPVSDAHSGVASGQIHYRRVGKSGWAGLPTELVGGVLRARVESAALPAGKYEFKLEVLDVAGNEAISTLREDGKPMVLNFPLKTATTLEAMLPGGSGTQAVPYRQPSKVSGQLTTKTGEPIAGVEITVTERFDSGSLIGKRVRTVTTDGAGRYGSALPGGPSREIEVKYSGSKRYAPDNSSNLDLNVMSKASFRTSKRKVRAGRRVRFRGNVRRHFAAIPPGGKLIELQVKEGARKWGTIREAFPTRATGSYKLKHRFKRFYLQPTTFKFRVKVTKEQGWPYTAPVRSRARKVTIVPR